MEKHLLDHNSSIKEALNKLNQLGMDAILFVVDETEKLIGSLTDGDVRRGLIEGKSLDDKAINFIQPNPKYIFKKKFDIGDIIKFKENNFKIIPVVDEHHKIVQIINFRILKSYLPVDAVLMAGGKGERLRPLTNDTPKPLLKVGNKPIIEHNIDNLVKYGIDDFHISINYLGDQIEQYLGNGSNKSVSINYVRESFPSGTAGSISLIEKLENDYILLTNSDILTTLNYEEFFLDFINKEADISIFSVPYTVSVPLGVLELDTENNVQSIIEKPSYTYYSNSGIYLINKKATALIPKGTYFDATDLIAAAIEKGLKIISYQSADYWLDIGTPSDFEKAQKDIIHLKF